MLVTPYITAYTHLISIDRMFSICHYLNSTEAFLCLCLCLCRRAVIFGRMKTIYYTINVYMHAECLWVSYCFKHTNTNIRASQPANQPTNQLASVYTCSMDEITQYAVSCTCQFFNRRRYLHILHNHYEQVDSFEILQFGCFFVLCWKWWDVVVKKRYNFYCMKMFYGKGSKSHHHNSHQYYIYIPWKMGKV